jgi:hypothetical protein
MKRDTRENELIETGTHLRLGVTPFHHGGYLNPSKLYTLD